VITGIHGIAERAAVSTTVAKLAAIASLTKERDRRRAS
jgi:hypothetical protein